MSPGALAALLLAAGVAAGVALFPRISDDIAYSTFFRQYGEDGCHAVWDWDIFFERLTVQTQVDKMRLANIVLFFFTVWPKWIAACVSGAACLGILRLGVRIAGVSERNLLPQALWMAYFILAVPWHDQLYLLAFQANYIWGGSLFLWLLYELFAGGGMGTRRVFFLALLVGAWNEAWGIPALAAVFAAMFVKGGRRSRGLLAAGAGLLAGTVWIAAWPGFWAVSEMEGYFVSRSIFYLPYAVPTLVYLVVLCIRRRQCVANPLLVALAAGAVASTGMMLYSAFGARVGLAGLLCSGMGLLYIYVGETVTKPRIVLSAVIYAFLAVHIAAVDAMCARLGRETDETYRLYALNPREAVFAPMTLLADSPWLCLGKPYYGWWGRSKCVTLLEYWGNLDNRPILAVPERLREFAPGKAEAFKDAQGFYLFRGLVVGPERVRGVSRLEADYGRGLRPYSFYAVPFANLSGRWAWYNPDSTYPEMVVNPQPLGLATAK